MDANGTRYHLLLGEPDWVPPRPPEIIEDDCRVEPWDASAPGVGPEGRGDRDGDVLHAVCWDARRLALTLWRRVLPARSARALAPAARRGAGRDRYGNWYWIDDDGARVMVRASGSDRTTVFWPTEPAAPAPRSGSFRPLAAPPAPAASALSGLAVTAHHYLVVGTRAPAGLLVFDLHAGGPPRQLLWPVPFAPFDMAPAPQGGVWILDRAARALWVLDAHLAVLPPPTPAPEPADFQRVDGGAHQPPRRRPPLAPTIPLSLADPVAVEALADGSVLVLDQRPTSDATASDVWRYRLGAPTAAQPIVVTSDHRSLQEMADRVEAAPGELCLFGHDLAVAGTRLDVVTTGGEQAFSFTLALDAATAAFALDPLPNDVPLRFFGGKAIVAAGGRVFYDYADTWVDLVARPRARYVGAAVLRTRVFDGKEPGCVWHRLLLDATIPGGARVEVWSRAADERADLVADRVPWDREPDFVLRAEGSELPHAPRLSPMPDRAGQGTWDLLFQRARGRYLELRLRLSGDGSTTPELRALRAYYPRFSYLDRYLPAVYREDLASASFLDRFLALFEGFFTSIEDRVAAAQVLLDVRAAPAEALDWLASFFDVALDPAWDDARRRLFLRHAADFFRWRGTARGLTVALELATARCPDPRLFDEVSGLAAGSSARRPGVRIVEGHQTRRTPGAALGDPTDLDTIRAVPSAGPWTPEQGRARLVEAWRAAVASALPALDPPADFPVLRPTGETRPLWRAFCRRALGFEPSATAADVKAWSDFLRRAYRGDGSALSRVWSASDFTAVPVPAVLPDDGARLADWARFEGVLAVQRDAHRFKVVLPVPPSQTGTPPDYAERRRLAQRIVELEKPAHATFDVLFYWAAFLVGEARVGLDTQVDLGSRSPELLGPAVLGESYVAASYLAPRPPQDAADRRILGRDPIRR